MLKQKNRLRSRYYFKATLDKGVKFVTPVAVIYALPHQQKDPEKRSPTKFGFIVSKKVSKKAVIRNKVKRRLREIIRQSVIHHDDFKSLQNIFCLILIARQTAVETPFQIQAQQITAGIQKLLNRLQGT